MHKNRPYSTCLRISPALRQKKKTTTQLLSQFVTSVALISCRKDASRPPNVWARGNPAATTLLPQGSTVCVGLGRAPHSKNNKLHLRLLCGKDWHVLISSECTIGALCIIYTIDIMLYRCNATVVVYAFRVYAFLCIGTTYMCLHCIHHKGTCHLLNNSSSVCTSEQGRSISHIDNLFLLLSSLQPGV